MGNNGEHTSGGGSAAEVLFKHGVPLGIPEQDSQCFVHQEQIDAMLSGNLSFDTKKEGEDEEEGGRKDAISFWKVQGLLRGALRIRHDAVCSRPSPEDALLRQVEIPVWAFA